MRVFHEVDLVLVIVLELGLCVFCKNSESSMMCHLQHTISYTGRAAEQHHKLPRQPHTAALVEVHKKFSLLVGQD